MKKLFYLTIIALVGFTLTSCETGTPADKNIKKEVKQYLKKNLKDPDSLKDLVITYAPISDEEARNCWLAEIEKYEQKKTETQPALYSLALRGKNTAIILIEYRAKNSYGAYTNGLEALKYGEDVLTGEKNIAPLKSDESYLLSAMLNSPNKKELK